MTTPKNIWITIVTIFFCLSPFYMQAQNLDDHLWKNRILVLFETGVDKEDRNKQFELLKSIQSELNERDIHIEVPSENERFYYQSKFNLSDNFSGLILIGKDGTLKMQQEYPVDPFEIFQLIDGMPMRKAEIKRKKRKSP